MNRSAQYVVACHDEFQTVDEFLQMCARSKSQLDSLQVRVVNWIKDVMKKNTFLQWRQRINILNIATAAGDGITYFVNLFLRKAYKRQQFWGDRASMRVEIIRRYYYAFPRIDILTQLNCQLCENGG